MKNRFFSGFLCGALIFGAAGVLAATYTAADNPFPIQLNGVNVQMEGYNIEGSTYFKLRDIASVVGGFDVGFRNDTIQLAKDGYVYPVTPGKIYSDQGWVYEHQPTEFNYKLPQFNMNTDSAKAVNARIDSAYAAVVHSNSDVGTIGYNTHENGNILSLVTKGIMTYDDYVMYTANTINTSTGNELTNSQLAEMAGTNMDAVLNLIGDKIEENLNSLKGKVSDAEYNQLLARAYSSDCYGENMPMYFDSQGHLIVIPRFITADGEKPTEVDTGFTI